MSSNGAAVEPTGPLFARTARAAETRAHELEAGLSWHIARLRAASEDARRGLEAGLTTRRKRLARTMAIPSPTSSRRVDRVFERLRAQGRRTRAAVAVALAVAVLAGTGAFVATQGRTGERRSQRPTSTSVAHTSRSTTTTSVAPDGVSAPDARLAPDAPPGSAVPASTPGVSAAPSTSRAAPGLGTAAAPAPGSTGAPPANDSPPSSSPPRNPTCQLLPPVGPYLDSRRRGPRVGGRRRRAWLCT